MADKKPAKKRTARLGKGLSSLMAQSAPVNVSAKGPATPVASDPAKAATPPQQDQQAAQGLTPVPIEAVIPNPHQPRKQFNNNSLQSLCDSIKQNGLMQPIIVRPSASSGQGGDATYELVAGERRWRAAKLAGVTHVPAIVRDLDDGQLAEWALIENLQREDLNPIERAEAFAHLAEQFKLSHEQIAERVGVNRPTISNALRLLTLHGDVQQLIRDGLLSAGQAKALAGIDSAEAQRALAVRVVKQDLSVRQVEAEVRALSDNGGTGSSKTKKKARRAAHVADLEKQITQHLGTKVRITPGRKKGTGTLSIEFYSNEQFEGLLEQLGVKTE